MRSPNRLWPLKFQKSGTFYEEEAFPNRLIDAYFAHNAPPTFAVAEAVSQLATHGQTNIISRRRVTAKAIV